MILALSIAGCTSEDSDNPDETPSRAAGEPMELKVLGYNIEYGGDASTDQVIREIDADIVGVQESYNRLPEIAEETGYPYYNIGLQLLSKYPIHEPSGADGLYALIEVQPGYAVAMFNTHLDYVKYGTKLLLEGMPLDDVIESENEVRTNSMEILTPSMADVAAQGFPVFLTGDFNQPSSLDYTAETVGTREGITEPVPWPVSEVLLDIGLRDTFREMNPDPVENPGITKDNPDFREGGFGDRIDYLFAGGPGTTLSSELVGERGGPNVDIGFPKWTSDHRAIVGSFDVTPLALPTTVSLDRRMLTEGDILNVYYNAPGNDETSIAVVPEEGDASESIASTDAGESGETPFDTSTFDPSGYDIVMLNADGTEIARNSFWVRSEEASVRIETDAEVYGVGEPIEVTWDDGPANRWDWIGVYQASAPDPKKDDYLLWGYTGGHESGSLPPAVAGAMTLDETSQGNPWPLPPGKYVVHYLLTDQYNTAGFAEFEVEK